MAKQSNKARTAVPFHLDLQADRFETKDSELCTEQMEIGQSAGRVAR